MSWRIATRHVSSYRYASTVFDSYNEARMTPVASHRQAVLDSHAAASLRRLLVDNGLRVRRPRAP
jgi:Bacterial transglutaminase-like N-terminal region